MTERPVMASASTPADRWNVILEDYGDGMPPLTFSVSPVT